MWVIWYRHEFLFRARGIFFSRHVCAWNFFLHVTSCTISFLKLCVWGTVSRKSAYCWNYDLSTWLNKLVSCGFVTDIILNVKSMTEMISTAQVVTVWRKVILFSANWKFTKSGSRLQRLGCMMWADGWFQRNDNQKRKDIGGPGAYSPGKFWNLSPQKCNFQHFEGQLETA